MPKITPARPDAHAPHAESLASLAGTGWCLPCYEAGSTVLAVDPAKSVCVVHARDALSGSRSAAADSAPMSLVGSSTGAQRRSRPPRGSAARPPAGRPADRAPILRLTAARARARGMAYGRRRAAARIAAGRYTPHPGWRHLVAHTHRVLVDQAEALTVVEQLVEDTDWRTDKRTAWSAILRQLVCSMDWTTGLISAVTLTRLGDAGHRAPRTVSRVIAWARDTGLLVVVEHGASAEFLGTDHGRTPTYVLVAAHAATPPLPAVAGPDDDISAQLTGAVEENGGLPLSQVEYQPLNSQRLEPTKPVEDDWPIYGIPRSAPERTAATRRLIQRLGIDRRGVPGVPLWRARALLLPWWDAGACPAALLWAIDHHPDHPGHHRGDALRGTHDPLRVIGARLQPWQDRLHELPTTLTGQPGNYRTTTPPPGPVLPRPTPAQPAPGRSPAQLAAIAAWEAHRAQLRARRVPDACLRFNARSRSRRVCDAVIQSQHHRVMVSRSDVITRSL